MVLGFVSVVLRQLGCMGVQLVLCWGLALQLRQQLLRGSSVRFTSTGDRDERIRDFSRAVCDWIERKAKRVLSPAYDLNGWP